MFLYYSLIIIVHMNDKSNSIDIIILILKHHL